VATACAVAALLGIGAATALASSPPPPPPPPPPTGGGTPPPATTTTPPTTTTPTTRTTPAPPPDTRPPARVGNLRAVTKVRGRVTLEWSNPGAADLAGVVVRRGWGACPGSRRDGVRIGGNSVRTRQVDTSAASGATYCYGVFAFDANGNYARAAYKRGVTIEAVVVTPRPVTDFTATTSGGHVVLTWRNPAHAALAFIAVRRGLAGGCPTGPADGTPIGGESVRTTQTDTTAQAGVTYCYRVFALDAAGDAAATTPDADVAVSKPAVAPRSHPAANPPSSAPASRWMPSTLNHAVAGIAVIMLLVMAAATAVTRRRTHTSAYVGSRDLGPRLAISGYTPVALVIPALLILGSCAAIVLVLINL
jgi:hypothetical protein